MSVSVLHACLCSTVLVVSIALAAITLRDTAGATHARYPFLAELGVHETNEGVLGSEWRHGQGELLHSVNPATGERIASVTAASPADYDAVVERMADAQRAWQRVPMPQRGEVVRQMGDALRANRDALGQLVALEMGKIVAEGVGEVQEFIDICDFAVGLSRTLAGLVLPSERAEHTLLEQWHPLGRVGIISAFNFPVAVYGWNLALSLVAGNANVHKGAPTTPLAQVAMHKLLADVLARNGADPALVGLTTGGADIGARMTEDARLPLISFTGSTRVGRHVGAVVAQRLGRSILELGGNNAIVVLADADLELTTRSIVFAAVGTAGQRCTTCRRILVHEDVYAELLERLVAAYRQIRIGDPSEAGVLCGPLHTEGAVHAYEDGIARIKAEGGKILVGGGRPPAPLNKGNYVLPTIAEVAHDSPMAREELFAPVLYAMRVRTFDEAVALNNAVPQGLSSSLFTRDYASVMRWIGPGGSDCGIVNVNIPTNGAEIGGAFGGNKDTGWGRESGGDAWKAYMRRSTATLNYGSKLPLAQGIQFA